MNTEFRINFQKYKQFSACSTEKTIEEVYNYITIKQYKNDTTYMFSCAFANIYQTKVRVSHAGTDTHYSAGERNNHTIHLCKNEKHYELLVGNITKAERKEGFIKVLFRYLPAKSSRTTFIGTNSPACQLLVCSPKYFQTWVKIIIKLILSVLCAKVNTYGKKFYYLGNQNKNAEKRIRFSISGD